MHVLMGGCLAGATAGEPGNGRKVGQYGRGLLDAFEGLCGGRPKAEAALVEHNMKARDHVLEPGERGAMKHCA